MIRLIQRRLIIPRGDTGSFSIPILAGKNTGDVAVFTVFDLMTQKKLLEKTATATNDTLTIEFNHNDTVNLPVGQFVWDIKYYVNPVFADGKLVDGEEIDSYYAAFTLPVCEIRQTGDMMLMVNDAALPPDQLDILLATLNATIAAKNEAVTSAAEADTSATNAETSASAALASEQAALESQNAALASQQAAAASAQQALAGAELATIKAEQIAADISNKADRSEIPIKVSDLTDDSGHYTKPANGIPASDLEETYLTEHQDLSNYVQKTDYATSNNGGVVKVNGTSNGVGLKINGTLVVVRSISSEIKAGSNTANPIVPVSQHESTFYGLAKAAGSDEKNSELPVGQYTNAAKTAIQTMLDVPSNTDLPLKADKTDTVLETTLSRGRKDNTTVGGASLAFGINTEASGYYSVALGLNTTASSQGAFAEGKNTVARYIAHAEGEDTQALGQWAHSQGVGTVAKGAASFAGGDNTIANGHSSFVTGRYNAADSYDNWEFWTANTSYAVGDKVKREQLVNNEPTIIGYICKEANTDVTFDISHWDFDSNHMNYSVIVGNGYEAEDPETHQIVRHGSNAYALDWDGNEYLAGDVYVNANPDSTGGEKLAKESDIPDVSGYATKADTVLETTLSRGREQNTIIGDSSFAFGTGVTASGQTSHAEGMLTTASGGYSHAEGMSTIASGNYSHAEGRETTASGSSAHTEGQSTVASGNRAHAEGWTSVAAGAVSHTEGYQTAANGTASHAEGYFTISSGRGSHAGGQYNIEDSHNNWDEWVSNTSYSIGDKVKVTTTANETTTVKGYICKVANSDTEFTVSNWNQDFSMNYAEIIGNGTSNSARSNAYALDWDGNGHFAGDVYVGANADSTGGTKLAKTTDIPDVQINGTSIVENSVANIPYAGRDVAGVVKIWNSNGINVGSGGGAGELFIVKATPQDIKPGTNNFFPIVPSNQHQAVFYGLAKAAGDTTQSASSNAVGVYTDSAKTAIKNMLGITQTLTVTVLTQDNVTVTGQTVTIRAVDATGPIFATAAYEGQPVSFALPTGFSYYVSVSDTLAHHFNPTTASGIITDADAAATLTYSDFSSIQTAADIKAALNAGLDLTDLVGEQISCTWNNSTLVWDVVDYSNDTITLLTHDTLPTQLVFEPVQALMWCENGLAAGSYSFIDGSSTYYFTLTTAIPSGGQLRATTSAFQTYASMEATATLETGTVSTTEISGATSLGTTATGNLNHMSRVNYGSNNYKESALFQWLNSTEAANTPMPRITKFSRPCTYSVPGFLGALDSSFVTAIDDTTWLCSTNNTYECPTSLGGTVAKSNAYTVTAKVGLASEMEISGSYGGTADGSTIFDLFNGATADDRKKYQPGTSTARYWWLRSPNWSSASYERSVHSSGTASSYGAYGSVGVVPAVKISKTVVSE